MQGELREKVARIVAPGAWSNCDQNGRAWAEQWTEIVESEEQADAIIATIRDALLSDEVVEAGARAVWREERNAHAHSEAFNLGWYAPEVRTAITAAFAKIGAQNVER